jgi:D-alanyl-D-alanine carboxypeptidase
MLDHQDNKGDAGGPFYRDKIAQLHADLHIPLGYAQESGLTLFGEPPVLVPTELDFFGREQSLSPPTLLAWNLMRDDAAEAEISLILISAFRSAEYQAGLIRRKLDRGQSIDEILSVNAAPGYSEHHTGRAIDIGSIDCPVLEEAFEESAAFTWLIGNAARFGFALTYPRENNSGICYEPWHWCYQSEFETDLCLQVAHRLSINTNG